MAGKLSVGIVTYNRSKVALRAIQSVYDQDVDDIEVIVVDNNSKDGTVDAIRQQFPEVKLICLARNVGCPAGRNHTFANCTGDYIINLDDDGYLGKGAAKKVIEVFETDPSIGVIAMKQCFINEPESSRSVGETGQEVVRFFGGVSAFRMEMLEKTGYYPDDFFIYNEEAVLGLRVIDAGWRIVSRNDIIMWHPRFGGGTRSKSLDYYRFRNSLLVVTRLFPGWLMVKYLILRLGSYFLTSIKNRTFHKYLLAVWYVLSRLPATLIIRKPCRRETVEKYFRHKKVQNIWRNV